MLEKTINNAICALLFRCEQQSVKEMDKIHAMQLFIKVAELESFSRAADFFALPKGSVSRQIQALEHQLGTQLLQRTTRRVKLTPEGMTYYQRAKDVLSNLSELDGLFQQDATSISGKLRIDIPPGIAKSLLLPRLSEFLYLHPGIELELSSHDRPVDILHDGFDCVIPVSYTHLLIVEFAVEMMQKEGKTPIEAIIEAARMRLRPILMTSLAFILGVLPLVISHGAGSGAQNAVGTGVMGGMFAATVLAIYFVPVFFVVVEHLFARFKKA